MLQSVVFHTFGWICWEMLLADGHESLQSLDVFPLCFVVQDVSYVFGEDLFSAGTSVDTHHGDADGPRGVSDRHLKIRIVGFDVFSFQHKLDDVCDGLFDVSWDTLLTQFPEERFEVGLGLGVGGAGQFALDTALHVFLSAVQVFGPNAQKESQKLVDDVLVSMIVSSPQCLTQSH